MVVHTSWQEQLEIVFNFAPCGMIAVDNVGRILIMNAQIERMFGYFADELTGKSVEILLPERLREIHSVYRQDFAATAQARSMGAGRDLSGRRKDGSEFPIEIGLNSIKAKNGDVVVIATLIDITERKRIEEHKEFLLRELHHRIRNLFSVIQTVATLSLTGDRTVVEGRNRFIDRLHALAHAYTMLTDRAWSGVLLHEIAQETLAAFPGQVELAGEAVMVRPSAAQAFALLLHELTTNAVKHGALTRMDGRVSARWLVDRGADPILFSFDWEERSGARIDIPAHKGFGRMILEQVGRQFGNCDIKYAAGGFRYRLDAPLDLIGSVVQGASRA